MRIGVPTEIKNHEYRVGIAPDGVRELAGDGHEVLIQAGAGLGSAITDAEYLAAGARVVPTPAEVWAADLVVKVKEPLASEYGWLRRDQVLFTYLHLAADLACTRALLDAGTTALAYETVQRDDGSLPLLAPMSEVAGRLSVQVGAYHLMRPKGGRGVLLGGVPGVTPAEVVIIGGGVAGTHAAEMAVGMRAHVTVLDTNVHRLRELDAHFGGRVRTLTSSAHTLENAVLAADLVIGAVLVAGARAPKLVSSELVTRMRHGAVLVDIAIDQGGCFADSRPTTHADPTYPVHDTVFYCVANMPGAVPATSTWALTGATLPYLRRIAADGWQTACREDAALRRSLTTHAGELYSEPVARAHDLSCAQVGM